MSLSPFLPTLGFTKAGNFIGNVEAKQIFCKTLDVDGNVAIDGNLTVSGSVIPSGDLTVTGNLTVNGNTTLGNAPADTVIISGPLTVTTNLTVNGNTTLGDAPADTVLVSGALTVNGNTTLGNATTDTVLIAGDLSVNGNTVLGDAPADTVLVSGSLQVNEDAIIGTDSSNFVIIPALAFFTATPVSMNTGGIVTDHQLILDRQDTTVTNQIVFSTGAATDWTLQVDSAGSSALSLFQSGAATNQNFVMALGTGVLGILGGADASLGFSTDSSTVGFRYTGGGLNGVVGASPRTQNTRVGLALFNAIADTAVGADATVVISNNLVTATTHGIVAIQNQTVAATASFQIQNVTYGASSITIALRNVGAATSGANGTANISFILFD